MCLKLFFPKTLKIHIHLKKTIIEIIFSCSVVFYPNASTLSAGFPEAVTIDYRKRVKLEQNKTL